MTSIRPDLNGLIEILNTFPLRFYYKTKDPNTSYYVFKLGNEFAIIPQRYVVPFYDDKVKVGDYKINNFMVYVMRPRPHVTVYYLNLMPENKVAVFNSEDLNEAVLLMLVDKYVV